MISISDRTEVTSWSREFLYQDGDAIYGCTVGTSILDDNIRVTVNKVNFNGIVFNFSGTSEFQEKITTLDPADINEDELEQTCKNIVSKMKMMNLQVVTRW